MPSSMERLAAAKAKIAETKKNKAEEAEAEKARAEKEAHKSELTAERDTVAAKLEVAKIGAQEAEPALAEIAELEKNGIDDPAMQEEVAAIKQEMQAKKQAPEELQARLAELNAKLAAIEGEEASAAVEAPVEAPATVEAPVEAPAETVAAEAPVEAPTTVEAPAAEVKPEATEVVPKTPAETEPQGVKALVKAFDQKYANSNFEKKSEEIFAKEGISKELFTAAENLLDEIDSIRISMLKDGLAIIEAAKRENPKKVKNYALKLEGKIATLSREIANVRENVRLLNFNKQPDERAKFAENMRAMAEKGFAGKEEIEGLSKLSAEHAGENATEEEIATQVATDFDRRSNTGYYGGSELYKSTNDEGIKALQTIQESYATNPALKKQADLLGEKVDLMRRSLKSQQTRLASQASW